MFSLPIINSSAHEWNTLLTSITNLQKLNSLLNEGENRIPFILWCDMDLYKRVLKLSYLVPRLEQNWILMPGPFHVTLCALRCLGKTVEGSDLDELWVEADIFSSVTLAKIIEVKHYKRALLFHEVNLQILLDLRISSITDIGDSLNVLRSELDSVLTSLSGSKKESDELAKIIKSSELYARLKDSESQSKMHRWLNM